MPDENDVVTEREHHVPERVWPVFTAYLLLLGGILVGGGVLAGALVGFQEGRVPSPEELQARIAAAVLTPPAIIGSILLNVSLLIACSVLGASLSRQPFGERLRLRKRSVPLIAYPISIVGLLVVGQTLEYVAIWLGLRDGTSVLDIIADVVAGMPETPFLVFLVAGSFGAGFAEELFFRGYMQTRLTSRFGFATGLVVSSIAFGIVHFDPLHATLAFFLGIYLGWLSELSGSIALPIVAHIGNNFVAFAAMRATENTSEAPISYFVVSVALALGCVILLRRIVPRKQIAVASQTS